MNEVERVLAAEIRNRTTLLRLLNRVVIALGLLGLIALGLLLYLGRAATRSQLQALVASEAHRFRALIEHSVDAVVLLDEEHRVRYASPAAPRLLGFSASQLEGKPALSRVHPDDLPMLHARFEQVLQAPGTTTAAEFRRQHADGRWVWLHAVGPISSTSQTCTRWWSISGT